jgi:membrane fusion protein (multidrug efflux system)
MNAAIRAVDTEAVPSESPPAASIAVAAPAPAASTLRLMLIRHRAPIAVALAVVIALAGTGFILTPARSETTEDAYVGADATSVAPKVRGLVAEVLVRENQTVRAGDPLVRIDPEEFDAKVGAARADLIDAEAGVATAKAAFASLDAEERLAAANVAAARTAIRSSAAEAERARLDSGRYDALVASGAVARRDADSIRSGAVTATQDAARAAALLGVARASSSVTAARRPTLEAALMKARAAVERARNNLELAQQDQRHALVLAPIEGVVGNRQVRPGDYVQPGTRLLTLVPLDSLYLTANFKETQTGRMRPGDRATVRFDALSGHRFTGVVDSLAPGSGSEFALLPFEPGTGNFTKIVQRVPVRIRFDPGQPGLGDLRPGLSATARVALAH